MRAEDGVEELGAAGGKSVGTKESAKGGGRGKEEVGLDGWDKRHFITRFVRRRRSYVQFGSPTGCEAACASRGVRYSRFAA